MSGWAAREELAAGDRLVFLHGAELAAVEASPGGCLVRFVNGAGRDDVSLLTHSEYELI